MRTIEVCIYSTVLFLAAALISGCGGSSSNFTSSSTSGSLAVSYSTTSSKGDYSEWTLTGDALSATWNVVNSGGAIDYSYNISATCGSADSYGIRSCTTVSGTCTDGASTCPGSFSGSFDLMEVPNVALFVQTGTGSSRQLHIGFAKDSGACTQDVSGDYTVIRTGLGLIDNFGLYRSDANFLNVEHADFGFDTPDANNTQSVAYRTGTASETYTDGGCSDGVRTRITGSSTIRSMMTSSGLFVLDLPAGQGGLLSFKVDKAASLSDFANKNFGGISFPDDSDPQFVSVSFGPVTGSLVNFSASFSGGVSGTLAINAIATGASAINPAYPNFSTVPTGYASAALAVDYPNPAAIPGLFKIDNPTDKGRTVIAAMKFGGKVIGMGMVYNYRTTSEINPSTGLNFTVDGLYNTGNFLLFEK